MIIRYLLIIVLLYCPVAQARMYQWIDPDSGTTQLSGKPPVWYRSNEKGPRIIVIENGKVVDDTSIKVSNDVREILRQRAYMQVEDDRSGAVQKPVKAEKFKSEFDNLRKDDVAEAHGKTTSEKTELIIDDVPDESTMKTEPVTDGEETSSSEAGDEEVTEEQMRARIQEWENKRTEEAKKLLEPGT